MKTGYDCGFRAQLFSLQDFKITEDMLYEASKWADWDNFIDNALDSHWHHFFTLETLGIPYEINTLEMLLSGQCVKDKTIILVHDLKNPFMGQHWVVFKKIEGEYIHVHWGDGKARVFTKKEFGSTFNAAWPNIVYTIGRGSSKLGWLPKQYVKLTRFLFGRNSLR